MTKLTQANVQIIGHRGCRGLRSENTLAAFKHALEMGVDGIEMDVHLTKDGQAIVYHDYALCPHVTRTDAGTWFEKPREALSSLTYDELRQYKLGEINPHTDYKTNYPDIENTDDEPIPLLKDVLDLARDYPDVQILIEIKTTRLQPRLSSDPALISKVVVEEIKASGLKDRSYVLAFDPRVLKHVKQSDPTLPLYFNYVDMNLSNTPWYKVAAVGWFKLRDGTYRKPGPVIAHELGADYWSCLFTQLSPQNINQAHDLGLKVMAWTVNSVEEARRMIQMGVDIIATDRPDLLLGHLGRM
jgi:glycerophosphoryl diester phosphodiesterase